MKLNTEQREITRSGPFRETGFRIAANAKAFDILSSKLYTDTRLAIVRELSTNAYDAQVDAGNKDRPFDVHLPNRMEPYFSIRDYGTGMSQETVESVYTTYFESTRSSSNDFVGALGLGSKSPFSYTDQFTVTSFCNGIKYTYSAFKGESGEPSIALLSQQDTAEENGVEIRINIDDKDNYDFERAARSVYCFFDPRPNITGVRIDFPEITPVFSGDGFALYNYDDFKLDSYVNIVMGNVCYSAPNDIRGQVSYGGRLVIFSKIGECSIAASREQLHDDAMTRTNIMNRLNSITAEINLQLKKSVENETCLMNKLIKLSQFTNVFHYDSNLIKVSDSLLSSKDGVYSLRRAWVSGNERMTISDNRFAHHVSVRYDSSFTFVHDDLIVDWKQSDKNKLRHWMIKLGKKEAFIAKITDEAGFKEVFGEPTIKMSQLPDAPKAQRSPRAASGNTRLFVKQYNQYGWHNVERVETEDACVVYRNGNKIVFNKAEYDTSDIKILDIAATCGFSTVYGIAAGRFDKINEELDLPILDNVAKDRAEIFGKSLDKYALSRMMYGVPSLGISDNVMDKMSKQYQTCKDIISVKNAASVSCADKFLLDCFGVTLPKAENYAGAFKIRYPLLSNVSYYANINDVIEYIELKESKNV